MSTGEKLFKNGLNKSIVIKLIIIISIIFTLFIGVSSIIVFANNQNNIGATVELNVFMFQIETKIIDLNKISDSEYINTGRKFAALINAIGKVKSKREHYFRNNFSRAPENLDEMVKIILKKENNIFKWELLPWQSMSLHMYGKDGEYNLKFISADGHFEAVYNREGILLTKDNDPLNMGTFNYAHQLADLMTHYNLDVWPYFMWNNTEEAVEIMNNEGIKEPAQAIDKNEDAMKRYKEYEKLLQN